VVDGNFTDARVEVASPDGKNAHLLPKMSVLGKYLKYRDPRCTTHLFGNPAILNDQNPWLCVTRLLWFCPFGDLTL
jgi:hypothetical protein